jgi:hypothetical protein
MNKFFKLGLLAMGVIFLYLYNLNLQNGRYQVDVFDDRVTVLDTWTSEYYVTDGEKRHVINPVAKTRKTEYYGKQLQAKPQTSVNNNKMENNNTEPGQEQEPQISDSRRMDEINAELKNVKMQLKQFQIWMTGKIKSLNS